MISSAIPHAKNLYSKKQNSMIQPMRISPPYSQPPIDIITFSEELKNYVTKKTRNNQPSSHYYDQCYQILINTKQDLAEITALNQLRTRIPQRFNRFPLRYLKIFFHFFIKIYNYVNGPQRAINHHLETVSTHHIHILQQLLLEQRKHSETQQIVLTLQKKLDLLSQRMIELEEQRNNCDHNG